jgi:tetratricopeptide (TPR) repeat protein
MMGHYDRAHDFFWRLDIRKESKWPDAVIRQAVYEALGRIALSKNEYFTAVLYFANAVKFEPDNWEYQYLLGYAAMNYGNLANALAALKMAKRLNPSNPLVLRYYALVQASADERSRETLRQAVDTGLYPEAKQDFDERETDLRNDVRFVREAIAADPKHPANFELLGRLYSTIGQKKDAVSVLRRSKSKVKYGNRTSRENDSESKATFNLSMLLWKPPDANSPARMTTRPGLPDRP